MRHIFPSIPIPVNNLYFIGGDLVRFKDMRMEPLEGMPLRLALPELLSGGEECVGRQVVENARNRTPDRRKRKLDTSESIEEAKSGFWQ